MKRTGIKIVRLVWQNSHTTAWETLNHALYHALQIGIATGMEFCTADFVEIESKYRPSYWLGEQGFERPYADAVAYGNTSFIKSFEKWKGRKPFLANKVKPYEPYPKMIHRLSTRARGRLALWYEFGDGWKVTSINGDVLVAVKDHPKRTVQKFTRKKLLEMFPAPKKAERVKK